MLDLDKICIQYKFVLMTENVVIAGAGPVGLFLGIELATAGVQAVVVERRTEPDRAIKAASVGAVAAEALERRGLKKAIEEENERAIAAFLPQLTQRFGREGARKKPGGHFSALFLIDQGLQREPDRFGRAVPQEALERILTARALELGVEIRRGASVEGFAEDDAGITVRTSAGELRAAYLVGCDGGHSAVRRLAGFDFVGTDPTLQGIQAVAELDDPSRLAPGWHRTPRGMVVSMPGNRVFTAEFDRPPVDRDAPVTAAELEAALRRVTGADLAVRSVSMATRWTDHARQATSYRKGRVFLAGDAAHVHSPFGGQGLNLGLVDAANLGWKLAAAVRGRDGLLDSYTAERHPVGARVLDNTRAQVALMRPDRHTTALRAIVADLMRLPEGNRYFGEMLTGLDTRYDLGDADPRVGTLVKDDPSLALYARMTNGGGVHVGRAPRSLPAGVQHLTADAPAMLVRPDGCIAWTEVSSTPFDDALARWFA